MTLLLLFACSGGTGVSGPVGLGPTDVSPLLGLDGWATGMTRTTFQPIVHTFHTYSLDGEVLAEGANGGLPPNNPAQAQDGYLMVIGNGQLHVSTPRARHYFTITLDSALDAGPSVAPGLIVAGDSEGVVWGFDDGGNPLWMRWVDGNVLGRPAIDADNAVYVLVTKADGSHRLVGIEPDGEERFDVAVDGTPGVLALGPDRQVLVSSVEPAAVLSFDADTGERTWQVDMPAPPSGPIVDANGHIIVVATSESTSTLAALDAADGSERWRNDDLVGLSDVVAADDGRLYMGCDGALCAVRRGNVVETWTTDGDQVWGSPAVQDGVVVAAMCNQFADVCLPQMYMWNVGGGVSTAQDSWARRHGGNGMTGWLR